MPETRQTVGTGPTYENGFTVFKATHTVESNATSVRVFAHIKGEKEKGCIDNKPSGFFDQVVADVNDFLSDIGIYKQNPDKNWAQEFQKLPCATVFSRLSVVVDGTETEIDKFSDYNFDAFDKGMAKTYGSELNGKTIVAKLYAMTQLNRNNSWKVFVESTY